MAHFRNLTRKQSGIPRVPKLFITYVNDLPDSTRCGEVYMCADDTTIYTIGHTSPPGEY